MNLRLYLLSGIWTALMFILLLSPRSEAETMYAGSIPLDAVVHFVLFAGFSHFWMSTLKKQRTFDLLFRNSVLLVGVSGAVLSILMECLQYVSGMGRDFQLSDMACNLAGTGAGLLSFRWLYRSCC